MSLSYRKRGKCWYARGTVRVGREVITVKEFSTGCSSRADAEAVGAEEEAAIRERKLQGPQAALKALTIADMISDYMEARNPRAPDILVLINLTETIGHYPLHDANEAWRAWTRTRGRNLAPASLHRWRAILMAAINSGCKSLGLTPPPIATVAKVKPPTAIYLSREDRDRLLSCYSANARPVAVTLCFQGLRSGEALRLDWQFVDFVRKSIFIHQTKTGRQRSIPMHPRVHQELFTLWEARGMPDKGTVFLTSTGIPYHDQTKVRFGGNPFRFVHNQACRRAGINGFTPHSWRHHWASWMVMSGCDLFTLMKLGGWSSLRMVERYAAVSSDHLSDAINRLT